MEIKDHEGNVLAIVIYSWETYDKPVEFITPPEFSQQLGVMNRPEGYEVKAHRHVPTEREVTHTQEVLFILQGILEVELYTKERGYHTRLQLQTGDIILLASGGHGFKMLSDCKIIEVKQGPYKDDKEFI